jgi:hypothetical protein
MLSERNEWVELRQKLLKKRDNSRVELCWLSEPWAAFLVLSLPNNPRIDSGFFSLAMVEFVGPLGYGLFFFINILKTNIINFF